ncbi:MAG: glutamine synthetase [Pseudobacteriovorax sp.]|nr:glutamine synthetase [Pseudobacteriovorax sp.]
MKNPALEKLLSTVDAQSHQKVKVAVTDIDGVLRGKYMHVNKFKSALEGGFGFCNVVFGWDIHDTCYENSKYSGWHTGYPDASVQLDPSTIRQIPWESGLPLLLGSFVDDQNRSLDVCPRSLLSKLCDRAASLGFRPMFGTEFEWFNFRETPQSLADKNFSSPDPLTPGMFGYSMLRSSMNQSYFHDIMDGCEQYRVPLEGLHTETGPGVFEAALQVEQALEQADRAVLFKSGVKEIAYQHDIIPSFMARWNDTMPGCSGHLHQSLWDKDGERNLFYDAGESGNMSQLFQSYLAGQLALLPEFLAMFAPTINSYKRLVPGFWAPTRANWGIDNRTVALRVIPGGSKSCRLETRVGGADMNPYLSIAAALAAGLYGIENKLSLKQDPIAGNGYESSEGTRFASTLAESSSLLRQSEYAREYFGEGFVEQFANSRDWEWQKSQESVTDWELKRYFELV